MSSLGTTYNCHGNPTGEPTASTHARAAQEGNGTRDSRSRNAKPLDMLRKPATIHEAGHVSPNLQRGQLQ